MTESNQIITIIVAASENNVIGKNNDLIWRLPNDLKRFKELTSGHCIIMGRKTYESLPGILPNRKHIVLTRKHKNEFPENILVVNNFEEALYEARDDSNPFIIGGGEIYKSGIKFAEKIELTRVHENFDGDTFFPKIDSDTWTLINRVENINGRPVWSCLCLCGKTVEVKSKNLVTNKSKHCGCLTNYAEFSEEETLWIKSQIGKKDHQEVADELGVSRDQLRYHLRKNNIKWKDFKIWNKEEDQWLRDNAKKITGSGS